MRKAAAKGRAKPDIAADRTTPRIPHPRETTSLAGHERAEAEFAQAIAYGRLHHAWLLTGEKGIGKATFAYRAARFLLRGGEPALEGGRLHTPPDHPISRQIAVGAHPSLFVLERSTARARGTIAVEDVRGLVSFLRHTSSTARRVVIVDTADDLTGAAANALLKGIEEPPPGTVFLLVSGTAGGVLATIRSRCVTLTFRALQGQAFVSAVTNASRLGGLDEPDAEAMGDLERHAGGSPGRALAQMAAGGIQLAREIDALFSLLPKLDENRLHALIAAATSRTEDRFDTVCDLIEENLERHLVMRVESGASKPQSARSLARIAELWEKLRERRRETDALNLDKASFLLLTFRDLATLDRPAAPAPMR